MSAKKKSKTPPKLCSWHVAVFFVIGVASSMPTTSFTTPKLYFMYKLRTVSDDTANDTSNSTSELNDLQAEYESYAMISRSTAIFIFNILTVVIASKVRLMIRLMVPFFGIIALLGGSLAFTVINTDDFQIAFLVITIFTIFFLTAASTIAFCSAMGFAIMLPPQYIVAVLTGSNFGTVVVAVINILTLIISPDPQISALYFFASSIFFVVFGIFITIISFRTNSIQFYLTQLRSSKKAKKRRAAMKNEEGPNSIREIISYILKKSWLLQLNFFFFHFTYGACYPPLSSSVPSMNPIEGDLWSSVLYIPVSCFLVISFTQFAIRFVTKFIEFPSFRYWRWISAITIARFAFFPLYIFSNLQPRNPSLPVVFAHDAWPIAFNTLLGLSTAYFGTLLNLYLSRIIGGSIKEIASIMAVTFVALGQLLGSTVTIGIFRLIS